MHSLLKQTPILHDGYWPRWHSCFAESSDISNGGEAQLGKSSDSLKYYKPKLPSSRTAGCISSAREIAGENFPPGISLSLASRSHRWSFIVDVHVHISPAINKVDPFSGGDVDDYTKEGAVREGSKCIVYSNVVAAQFIQRGRSSNIPISRFAWRPIPSTRRGVCLVVRKKKKSSSQLQKKGLARDVTDMLNRAREYRELTYTMRIDLPELLGKAVSRMRY